MWDVHGVRAASRDVNSGCPRGIRRGGGGRLDGGEQVCSQGRAGNRCVVGLLV